jgi:tetratricopeptide (TPR) repeat protein
MHPLNVSLVDECKQLGNELFKSNQLDQAVDAYSKAIHQYELAKQQHQQSLDTTTRETLAACYANRAQCNLVLHPHSLNDIKRDCDTAIQLKPNYFKALFRRAKVLQAQHNYVDAMKDLTACLSIEPQNKLVRETAGQVRTMIAIWEEKNRRPDVIIDKVCCSFFFF